MSGNNPRKSSRIWQRRKGGVTRRDFVAASAVGAALPLIGGRGVWAADSENTIRVGFVSPRTGNLGFFGQGDGYLATSAESHSVKVWRSVARLTKSICSIAIPNPTPLARDNWRRA